MGTTGVLDWFAGGATPYMTLYHCMNRDLPWVLITVALDLIVATGYGVIALHWWRQQRGARQSHAHQALGHLKNIFVFCGICGYLFIPIKMVWPAWRLYDLFVAVLAVYTWRYAWNARDLKVIYRELTRAEGLKHDLEAARAEAKAKDFFINALSHDLRTPLNGMMLQAEVAVMTLQEMDQTSEAVMEVAESLRRIIISAVATAEMLDGLLELGSLDVGAAGDSETTFDLGGLLRRVADASRTVAESKGLELHAEVPDGLLVHTVRAKLERVLLNLTGNALKFTNSGGVRLDVSSAGSEVTIHVTDTGPGIPGEHLPHLFTEYFQGHNDERDRRKGYGLGLAIARRLAVQLGGHLVVDSELGQGSRFSLTLPDVLAGRKPVASSSHAHR